MRFRSRLFILAILVTASLGLLFFTSKNTVQRDTIVAVDTAQVVANPTAYVGRRIRLRGFVRPTTLVRFTDRATFEIEQHGKTIPVYFNGATPLPDTFTDGAAVRAEGRLRSADGIFEASFIEAKCSSRYPVKGDQDYELTFES